MTMFKLLTCRRRCSCDRTKANLRIVMARFYCVFLLAVAANAFIPHRSPRPFVKVVRHAGGDAALEGSVSELEEQMAAAAGSPGVSHFFVR